MKTVTVQVQPDHVRKIAQVRRPIDGLIELIWNSFDAEATRVEVYFEYNPLGGIEAIRVRDNGHGIYYGDSFEVFRKLGGSWKEGRRFSSNKRRFLHGCQGRGRFSSFGIGCEVTWHTHYSEGEAYSNYKIIGRANELLTFEISDPVESAGDIFGTEVTISDLNSGDGLSGEKIVRALSEEFAIYLRQYPCVELIYDGVKICPSLVEELVVDYEISAEESETNHPIKMTVVEWSYNSGKHLFLCNQEGHALERIDSPLKISGFNYTVYVESPLIDELHEDGSINLAELHPQLNVLLAEIHEEMKAHFSRETESRRRKLVKSWKKEGIYPYDDTESSVKHKHSQKLFDHYAVNIARNLAGFSNASKKHKLLTLTLIKEVLTDDPQRLRKILGDTLWN